MKLYNGITGIAIALIILFGGCKDAEHERIRSKGPEVVDFSVLPFDIDDVTLLKGPFLSATELNIASLLDYEPDRLLSGFYEEAGLEPKAEHYMGWENESLAGHSLGHYLSGCALMYATTGDKRFYDRVAYIVSELKYIQDKDGEGYIGAFPDGKKILGNEVAKGDIRSQGFDLNGIWAPFYTQHKILAGLRDAYRLCKNDTALMVERRFADWIGGIVFQLGNDQIQNMLICEHGGISETMADLYCDTGDEKYLKISRIFYHEAVLDSLKAEKDILAGKHCNTNIPKLIALSRLYELTGDSSGQRAAKFFWQRVTGHHSYVTGGNGNDEYFGPAGKLRNRLGEGTTETCNVYNMLKLSEHLFKWDASAVVADFYERALFNHILSSQDPVNGRVTYNLSLDMGGYKQFQDPYDFTCCIGTAMESHSKYAANIYYHNNEELYVFQYIASELNWKEKGIRVIQHTEFPEKEETSLEFACDDPVKMAVMIRYPYWAGEGIEIRVNGREKRIRQQPGSFVKLERKWENGDRVDIRIPFTLRLESMPDDSDRVALMYGPLVLAGDLGPVNDEASNDAMYVPVMLTDKRDPAMWTEPVAGRVNTFRTVKTGRPRDVELRPFYTFRDRRYSVYWDLFSEADWQERQVEYREQQEKIKRLKEAEVDRVQPGEMQPERDHNFRGENTAPWSFRDRPYREARRGWFSFDLEVEPQIQNALVVEYWGGFPGAKTFDIIINGTTIATENISNKKDGQFILVQYDIPVSLTKGKRRITVRFQSHTNNTAGPVFGVRTIRKHS